MNREPDLIQLYRLPNGDYATYPRGKVVYTGEDARILNVLFKHNNTHDIQRLKDMETASVNANDYRFKCRECNMLFTDLFAKRALTICECGALADRVIV